MISRPRRRLLLGLVVALLLAGGMTEVAHYVFFHPKTVTAYFTSAIGIYPGDEVRVAGVKIGTIKAIQPEGTKTKMTMAVDRDVPIPADVKAVVVAANLVAARYVQLAPAYVSTGPTLKDDAVIPLDRTAVPVEWDEVKTQLMRLSTDLGPKNGVSTTSLGRFIDTAADALNGNGDKLRQTIAQLSQLSRVLADGSGNIVDIVKNLQVFVSALRDSNTEIVSFEDRLATLSSVIDDHRGDLDGALTNLSSALGAVQRFVEGSRNQTSEQIQRLANVTQNVVDHKIDLENILHVAPNAIANGYNVYNPDSGSFVGSFPINQFTNPAEFVCSSIGAIENATAPETAKLCEQYLGPALRVLNLNYFPMPQNPYLMKSADPRNILYTDPKLAPGGAGGAAPPPSEPPAISAYTGKNNDVGAPANYGQPPAIPPGPSAPAHLPAFPSQALFPGAPIPGPPVISGTPPDNAVGGVPLPAEAPAPREGTTHP